MALNQSRARSKLAITEKTDRLLEKLEALLAESSRHIVFEIDGVRLKAVELDSVVIDASSDVDTFQFKRLPFSSVAGTLEIQDLTYTGAAGDATDNDVSIEYIEHTPAVAADGLITITDFASLVSGTDDAFEVASVVFTAQAGAATPGDGTFQADASNAATATSLAAQINAHATASLAVTATAVGDTVELLAVTAGTVGNSITLTYTDNDTNVGATVSGAGTLENGAAAVGDAGNEVVTVDGNAITIQLEDGVSTATQVKAAYDAEAAATALATVAITGTGSNAQTAPEAEQNLAGGITAAAVEYYDKADVRMIKRLRTKKYLIAFNDAADPAAD